MDALMASLASAYPPPSLARHRVTLAFEAPCVEAQYQAALWAARRVRTPLDTILILQVILMASLGWRTLVFPHEMYRIPSLAILAALAVLLLPGGSGVSRESSSPDPVSR